MLLLETMLNDCLCIIDFVQYNESYSYVAAICKIDALGKYKSTICTKSFGNGCAAEEWILDTIEYPAFMYLKEA